MIWYFNNRAITTNFNDVTGSICLNSDIKPRYSGIRCMKTMQSLFENSDNIHNEQILYYTYGGICRKEDQQIFIANGITYEYSILLPGTIHGECIKTHGHIHAENPQNHTRRAEAFEILYGEGYFQLFRKVSAAWEIIMLHMKEGDCILVPNDFYHLSINTGKKPFIFADLIKDDVECNYVDLVHRHGAPISLFRDEKGLYRKRNSYWKEETLYIYECNANETSLMKELRPNIYEQFIKNTSYMVNLLEEG